MSKEKKAPAPSSLAGVDRKQFLCDVLYGVALDGNEPIGETADRILAALSPEAPAREVEAYDKFKAHVGSTVWIRATVTDNCTSCCSVVIDAIHGKMHLTVVPRDVALTPRHEAPAEGAPVFHMNLLSHEDNEAWLESARRVAAKHEAPAEGVGEDEWSELDRLADVATQGPWKACGTIYEHMNCEVRGGAKGEGQAIAQVWDGPNAFKDGQFIAAANPATIKRLIEALRARSSAPEA